MSYKTLLSQWLHIIITKKYNKYYESNNIKHDYSKENIEFRDGNRWSPKYANGANPVCSGIRQQGYIVKNFHVQHRSIN